MKWEAPLIEAVILKRYKRFLADVEINGELTTVHVPNTGSMLGCWGPNWKCSLSKSNNPNRKMPYTLELTYGGESWIGVNTGNANKLAHEWFKEKLLPSFEEYQKIVPEKKIGDSRIDFYLEDHPSLPPCYVEVKSVTLKLDQVAQFPDAVTERGQKHIKELIELKKKGLRAVMLFVVQREDVERMRPATSIDPEYSLLLKEAVNSGVEVIACRCHFHPDGIKFGKIIPVEWE